MESKPAVPLGEISKLKPVAICLDTHTIHLSTQAPHQIWLALPRGSNRPRGMALPLRFALFSGSAYSFGIEEHALTGGTVRIYSPAKTVTDCFKYRQKYGLDVAVEALREGWRGKKFTMKDLATAASACRVSRIMQPYLEMLTRVRHRRTWRHR